MKKQLHFLILSIILAFSNSAIQAMRSPQVQTVLRERFSHALKSNNFKKALNLLRNNPEHAFMSSTEKEEHSQFLATRLEKTNKRALKLSHAWLNRKALYSGALTIGALAAAAHPETIEALFTWYNATNLYNPNFSFFGAAHAPGFLTSWGLSQRYRAWRNTKACDQILKLNEALKHTSEKYNQEKC